MLKDAQNLSRRSFLAGAGVLTAGIAGGALVGCSPKATEPAAGSKEPAAQNAASPSEGAEAVDQIWSIPEFGEPTETIEADVCIVGAGGTGTAAAIQAIDLGLKPVVIERLAGYGGSFIGTEGMTGLETHFTEADGGVTFTGAYNPNVPYGVKNAMNTCLNYHHWIPQHKLYEKFFGQTSETIDWL